MSVFDEVEIEKPNEPLVANVSEAPCVNTPLIVDVASRKLWTEPDEKIISPVPDVANVWEPLVKPLSDVIDPLLHGTYATPPAEVEDAVRQ